MPQRLRNPNCSRVIFQAGYTADLEEHELTAHKNLPTNTLLLTGIHTKGEFEKSKYNYINGITFPDDVLYLTNLSDFNHI